MLFGASLYTCAAHFEYSKFSVSDASVVGPLAVAAKKTVECYITTKKMPHAGKKSVDRANAHLQWAEGYAAYGDTHKAAAHFGRALE